MSGLKFPTMLRKMWAGAEVQAWLDEQGEVIRLRDIPEGCTPTDAQVLREANHNLAVDAQRYTTLRNSLGQEPGCTTPDMPRITDPRNSMLTYTPEGLDRAVDKQMRVLAGAIKEPKS